MTRLGLPAISSRPLSILLAGGVFWAMAWMGGTVPCPSDPSGSQPLCGRKPTSTAEANAMLLRQPGFFVPNLGQWQHRAKFVHQRHAPLASARADGVQGVGGSNPVPPAHHPARGAWTGGPS